MTDDDAPSPPPLAAPPRRVAFTALVGGVLLEPRRTMHALASGQGRLGHIVALIVLRLLAGELVRLCRAVVGVPYFGWSGAAAELSNALNAIAPDVLAIALGGFVLGLLAAQRRERTVVIAAYAWVGYLTVELAAGLLAAGLGRSLSQGERRLVDAAALCWSGVLWLLGLLALQHESPHATPPPGRLSRVAGLSLVAALVLVLGYNARTLARQLTTLAPVGTQVKAPDFRLPLSRGGEFHLQDDAAAAVTVIDFWATWCGPCRAELPVLDRVWQRYRDRGVRVVAVNIEDASLAPQVNAFAARLGLQLPVALGGSAVADTYRIENVPQLLILDRSGQVQQLLLGEQSESTIAGAIDRVLERARPAR